MTPREAWVLLNDAVRSRATAQEVERLRDAFAETLEDAK